MSISRLVNKYSYYITQALTVIPLVITMVNYHYRTLYPLENSFRVVQRPVGQWNLMSPSHTFSYEDGVI